MLIRDAIPGDAPEISAFLQELTDLGKRTRPSDEAFVLATYISGRNKIKCSVAVDASGSILGLQSLARASEENPYGVTPGWGIIGTHIRPSAARRGVGRALFQASLLAARDAGIEKIDASIGSNNAEGLAYYQAMGFRSYRRSKGVICKCFEL